MSGNYFRIMDDLKLVVVFSSKKRVTKLTSDYF